jgi:hypothetical protein
MTNPVLMLDNNHDLYLGPDGNLAVAVETGDSVAQRVECRLKTFLGEHFLDRTIGVPYYEEVFKKNPDVGRVRALLLSVVKKVPGVSKILTFSVEFFPGERVFKVDFSVQASDGTIISGGI